MSGERWVAGAYALGTWEGGADEPARGGANCSRGCGLGGGGMLRPSPASLIKCQPALPSEAPT